MERKKELRKHIKGLKTLHANTTWRARQSAEILSALEAHPAFRAAHTVLLYHSLPDEVCTHAFVKHWCQHKRVLLPVVTGDDLELRLYTPDSSLAVGAFGIEEPQGAVFSNYSEIDLAVVPGVAFDPKGNRLGRGRGYYDRLLPRLVHACKIGICFPFQLVEEVPAEPFDIAMDYVIS